MPGCMWFCCGCGRLFVAAPPAPEFGWCPTGCIGAVAPHPGVSGGCVSEVWPTPPALCCSCGCVGCGCGCCCPDCVGWALPRDTPPGRWRGSGACGPAGSLPRGVCWCGAVGVAPAVAAAPALAGCAAAAAVSRCACVAAAVVSWLAGPLCGTWLPWVPACVGCCSGCVGAICGSSVWVVPSWAACAISSWGSCTPASGRWAVRWSVGCGCAPLR